VGQETVTQAELLRRVIDLQRLTTPPPVGERTAMFSSYDRRSRIDEAGNYVDWDANGDRGQFLGRDQDGWDVMAELAGPGAITRLWSANPHGDIRFVLDGEVVIDTTFDELLSGRLAPFEEPLVYRGLNCYFPIGFDQSCRVVCRDSSAYYQINTVQFPPGTPVQGFQFELDDAAQGALDEVKRTLEKGFVDQQLYQGRRMMPVALQEDLKPGKKMGDTLDGAGVVRALYVALTDRNDPSEPYALHRCILRVFIDGQELPSVEAPLTDFFGSGFDLTLFNSLAVGTDRPAPFEIPGRRLGEDRLMYCFFPMPFRQGLRVEIENLNEGRKAIGLLLIMQVDKQAPPADALRFYARFRKEDPCKVLDYPILETAGRGRVVGCVLNVDCPRAEWWGEGDDKVWIDGEKFPSYFGTGSEDYLGDAWGLHAHIRPLQGVTHTGPYGKNSAYRWQIADCINFQKSIRFTIENWQHGKAKDTYYSTVAYWYAQPGAKHFFKPLTLKDVTPPGLRIPGAVEVEGHVAGTDWGTVVKQKHAGGVEFSGEQAANITTDRPVQINIPSNDARTVRLKLRTNPRRSFETVTVTDVRGRTVGSVKYDRGAEGMYVVGVIRLEKGDNPVTAQCTRPAQLDCWVLEPLPKNSRGPEGEDLTVVSSEQAKVGIEYALLDWSAGGQLAMDFSAVDQTVTLALPERPEDGLLALRLHVTHGPDGGRFQTLIDGQPVGDPFDCYADQATVQPVRVGLVSLKKGGHTLGFRALEANPKAAGPRLGLDAVDLLPTLSLYAVECEDLPVTGFEGSHHSLQDIRGASGEAQVWCQATEPGAWIEFQVPVGKAGRYKLSIVYTRSFDYGIVQAWVNGQKVGDPVDTFARRIEPGLVSELGVLDLMAEPLRVKVQVIGKSDRSPGYFFGVDCVILEPVLSSAAGSRPVAPS
jgi:hypothetical protein